MPSALGLRVMKEQEEWAAFVAQTLDQDAWLFYVSPLDSDRRLYRFGDRIAKVRRLHDASRQSARQYGQELSAETAILQHLAKVPAMNRSPAYQRWEEWEVLAIDFVEGQPFSEEWHRRGLLGKVALAHHAARAILGVNLAGVCHDDIVASNLLVDHCGNVQLVDFGNATFWHPLRAIWREWNGLLFSRHGLAGRLLKCALLRVFPGAQSVYRRVKLRRVTPLSIGVTGDADLTALEEAWRATARWNTTGGAWLAYSSLTVAGEHFPGSRPWLLRWTRISEVASFSGKRILGLGCSTGLFCSFAMLAGARACHGVDSDRALIDAAHKIASAFGVAPSFEVANLDSDDPWEKRWRGADLVVAMSIMEWVNDRERLLRFLGEHQELLYEGHDSLGIELDRLRRVGFKSISMVMMSERGRPVLYARKTGSENESDRRFAELEKPEVRCSTERRARTLGPEMGGIHVDAARMVSNLL
jgi:hypothetical protein